MIDKKNILDYVKYLYLMKYGSNSPEDLLNKWRNISDLEIKTTLSSLYNSWELQKYQSDQFEIQFLQNQNRRKRMNHFLLTALIIIVIFVSVKLNSNFSRNKVLTDDCNYEISVQGGSSSVTLRNKPLTRAEFKIANSINPQRDDLNEKTIIGYLENGTKIFVIKDIPPNYKIRTMINGETKIGYIVSRFAGKPTIQFINE